MTPQELADMINDGSIKHKAKVPLHFEDTVTIQLHGYELVFHGFTPYGSGEWFINDTAD